MKLTNLNDYYEKIHEMFPEVDISDIKRILKHGWKLIYLINSYGADICIPDGKGSWIYFGNLSKDSLRHFSYYKFKLGLKIRLIHRRKHLPWDGYYYFALNELQYQDYIKLKNKRGRPKKYFYFKNVFLYKVFEEIKVRECEKPYIFRVSDMYPLKYVVYKKLFKTDKAELIISKKPSKLKDILITANKYETLWAKKLQPIPLVRG